MGTFLLSTVRWYKTNFEKLRHSMILSKSLIFKKIINLEKQRCLITSIYTAQTNVPKSLIIPDETSHGIHSSGLQFRRRSWQNKFYSRCDIEIRTLSGHWLRIENINSLHQYLLWKQTCRKKQLNISCMRVRQRNKADLVGYYAVVTMLRNIFYCYYRDIERK